MTMSSPTESLLSGPPRAVVSRNSDRPCQEVERKSVSVPTVSRWVDWGRWMFRHRGWIFAPLGGILVFQALAKYSQTVWEIGNGISGFYLAAVGFLALGICIRLHVAGRARPGTSSRGVTFEAGQLITTGMYAYVRNPLYLANLTIWAGLALLVGPTWWAGLLVGLAAFFYHTIVLAEEEYLAGRYPSQYADYCRQVPRWIPNLVRVFQIGEAKNPLPFPADEGIVDRALILPESFVSDIARGCGEQPPFRTAEKVALLGSPSPPCRKTFTWRRALFREADSIMLVLMAGWVLAGLGVGRLPWELPPGRLGTIGLGALAAAAVGWGWIKWLKKRSWPMGVPNPAPGASKGVASFCASGSVVASAGD